MQQINPGDLAVPRARRRRHPGVDEHRSSHEDEFNDWYNTEHIPHFNRLDGVIAARRFRAIEGNPRYVALYHVENTDIYATPGWMAANQTPWMLRMRRYQRDRTYFMFRRAYRLIPEGSTVSQSAPLTPEIIGRAIDNTPLNNALKFIIAVAAAGFLFNSFDITIVGYALPKIRPGVLPVADRRSALSGPRHWREWASVRGAGAGSPTNGDRRVVFASTVLMFSLFTGVAGSGRCRWAF